MATARDLVEANAYERRRLVAAFASGGPCVPVPEPARSGRTIAGRPGPGGPAAGGRRVRGAPRVPGPERVGGAGPGRLGRDRGELPHPRGGQPPRPAPGPQRHLRAAGARSGRPEAADRGSGDDRRPGHRSRDRHPRRPRGAARPRAARPDRVDRVRRGRAPPAGPGGRVAGSTPRPGRRLRRGEPGRALRRRPGGSRRHRGVDVLRLPAARRIATRGGRRAGHPARRARPADPGGGSRGARRVAGALPRGRRPGLAQLRADRLRPPGARRRIVGRPGRGAGG